MADNEQGRGGRVYREIKARILNGELRLRERLEVEVLARRLGVSATPVRQALMHLVLDRLVAAQGARGYHVAFWSEAELAELYAWRGALARIAVDMFAAISAAKAPARTSYADAVEVLFRDLEAGANSEMRRAALNADERLRAARMIEPEVLADAGAELKTLARLMQRGERRRLHAALRAYHRRRIKAAPALRAAAALKALPRNGG